MNRTFRKLARDYVALISQAKNLEEVNWSPLAAKLCLTPGMIAEVIEGMSQEDRKSFWADVVQERIKQAESAQPFQINAWERIGYQAAEKLLRLVEAGLIKDPGELLAISKAAESLQLVPQQRGMRGGQSRNGDGNGRVQLDVNFGFGNSTGMNIEASAEDDDMNGELPGSGETMRIDLSPRTAKALSRPPRPANGNGRVIDSTKLDVDELRTIGAAAIAEKATESEADENDDMDVDFEGAFDEIGESFDTATRNRKSVSKG